MKNYYKNNLCEVKLFKQEVGNDDVLVSDNQNKTMKNIYVNQIGYDSDSTKVATTTNFVDGTAFYLKRCEDNTTVFNGVVTNQKADFSSFTNNTNDDFYLQVGLIKSYKFKVRDSLILDTSIPVALKFMEMSRQDAFDVGGNTGYGWRDSHQFSFELNSLVMMYMSNPSYYESLPWDVYKVSECEYEELRVQNEPNIIWLIKFGVTRYYKWATEKNIQLHAFIKGQLAYFLYLYPHITKYVTKEFYETIRNFTISVWGNATCNKSWYEETITHNLFATESVVGSVKGANPPGYSIIPNLLMYEVLKRDGISGHQQYFDSAFNSCKWIVDSVDLDVPANTKGQRMSEYIMGTSLTFFYEMYPNECPNGLYEKIDRYADIILSRSNNIWDYRQYRTAGDLSGSATTKWVNDIASGTGTSNQPGNIIGLSSILYSMTRVLTNEEKNKKLINLAVHQIDHTYGRNPLGRHFCYSAKEDIEGADFGWTERYVGGYGNLEYCVGVLDGSPKEENYPFDPLASTGYTEGWIAFNTAWNTALAYLDGINNNGICIFGK